MNSLRLLVLSSLVGPLLGCSQAIYITRAQPPIVDPAQVPVVAMEVKADLGRQAERAVLSSVLVGQVAVPVDVENHLRSAVSARLPEVGITVCAQGPCAQAQGVLDAYIVASTVGPKVNAKGVVHTRAELSVRFDVKKKDGTLLLSRVLSDGRTGNLLDTASLMPAVANSLAGSLAQFFRPRSYTLELEVEDGGALEPGLDKLFTGNAKGAQEDFLAVIAADPKNAAAYYDFGVAAEADGDYPRAVWGYRNATANSGSDGYARALARAEAELQTSGGGAPGQ